MKLDSEQDRKILLTTMQQATVQGAFAAVFADLMRRIEAAPVEVPSNQDKGSDPQTA